MNRTDSSSQAFASSRDTRLPLMRLAVTVALVAGAMLGTARPASAQVLETASALRSGQVSLANQTQYQLNNDAFMNWLHLSVGTTNGVTLFGNAGFGMGARDVAGGGGVAIGILEDDEDRPALSISTGAHYQDTAGFGMDGTFTISKRFGRFTPFGGIDMDLEIADNRAEPELGLPFLGFRASLAEGFFFSAEGAYDPFNRGSYVSVGFGGYSF